MIPGSEKKPLPGVAPAAQHVDDEPITITVVLRRRAELPADLPAPISRAELAEKYGAAPADIDAVTAVVQAHGATISAVDPGTRRMRVTGPADTLASLFGTTLHPAVATDPASDREISVRARQGSLSVPKEIGPAVVAVLGLDNRPQGRTRLVRPAAEATNVQYTPDQLGTVYRFPADTDGSGQTVAIIELGGGFVPGDLDAYFSGLGIPGPKVTAVGVDGGSNTPEGDASGADGEVMLDIEVVGALAPKADIVVYFAPNTDAGFVDAVAEAAGATPAPASISISWGQDEDDWTEQARSAFDAACADAVALGVTVTAAAGDDGSMDRAEDGKDHCDFPASSPHVLACGGTSLQADVTSGDVTSEIVWNNGVGRGATGGGVSDAFPLPDWQRSAGIPQSTTHGTGRGVPDVSAVADPATGYLIRVDGESMVIGGTSAVAPLWAALVARLVQALGRPLGQLQPAIYAGAAPGQVPDGFRDITSGNNGGYRAGAGWDACTGLGVPNGEELLSALRGSGASSGD